MKNLFKLLMIAVLIVLFACESKQEIQKQISLLQAEVTFLKSSEAIKSYNGAIESLSSSEQRLVDLRGVLSKYSESESDANALEIRSQIVGTELRIEVGKKKMGYFKLKFDSINNLVEQKENQISNLEKKLE